MASLPAGNVAFELSQGSNISCSALTAQSFANVTIWTAEAVEKGANFTAYTSEAFSDLPAHCRVAGQVHTSPSSIAGFELWMPPASEWNQRYLSVGNGGWSGSVTYQDIVWGLGSGFATMSTDTGHNSSSSDSAWAADAEAEIDFGVRAMHMTTVAAKEITSAFYEQLPSSSYYAGCSTGGRQGLVEAQVYPEDFDGILVGSPVNNQAALEAWEIWVGLLQYPETLDTYLAPEEWVMVHEEIVRQCDSIDGWADGLVSDPTHCHFIPETMLCQANEGDGCLTSAQIFNVRRTYNPWYEANNTLVYDGILPGSELTGLAPVYMNAEEIGGYGTGYYRYHVHNDSTWDPMSITYNDVKLAHERIPAGSDGTNPDLRKFHQRGGKMIHYHGYQDSIVPPMNSARYYHDVMSNMSSYSTPVSDFYRLFMIPGLAHCSGGDGAWVIDATGQGLPPASSESNWSMLKSLVDWVENGVAPERIVGTQYINNTEAEGIKQTRPHCVWPERLVYIGGCKSSASSWTCEK